MRLICSICAIILLSCATNYGMRTVARITVDPAAIRAITQNATAGAASGMPLPSRKTVAIAAVSTGAGLLLFYAGKYALRSYFRNRPSTPLTTERP